MMLPSHVSIMGTMFEVRVEYIDPSRGIVGFSDQPNRYLLISKDLPAQAQIEVFYHELAHLVIMHLGLHAVLSNKKQEAIAQAFGVALADIVTANKHLPRSEA